MSEQPLAYAVQKVEFGRDGSLDVEFILGPDVKQNGLAMRRILHVPAARNWDDEIDAVYDAVAALIFDALEDVTTSEPQELTEVDNDEAGGLGE